MDNLVQGEAKELEKFREENKALINQENVSKAVVDITYRHKYELMRCANCPILKECHIPKKRLQPLYEKAKKLKKEVYDEEVSFDNSIDSKLAAEKKANGVYIEYINSRAMDVLKNDRCFFERREIMQLLQRFVDANYDISDPKAYIVITELIGNILQAGRINKAFTNMGVILTKVSKTGQKSYYANPLLKHKTEFSKFIIEAMEALDRMRKSDIDQSAGSDFTAHLLKEMKLRSLKKTTANIIDADFKTEKK